MRGDTPWFLFSLSHAAFLWERLALWDSREEELGNSHTRGQQLLTIPIGIGRWRRKGLSDTSLRTFIRDANLIPSWILGGHLEYSACSFHWGRLEVKNTVHSTFRSKSKGGMGSKRSEVSRWSVRSTLRSHGDSSPGALTLVSYRPIPWGEWGKHDYAEMRCRHELPPSPPPHQLSVFSRAGFKLRNTQLPYNGPVLAANVSHFVMHSPTGSIKVVYKGKAWAPRAGF